MKSFYIIGFTILCFISCKDIEDASPSDRKTFIRFFEKGSNYTGQMADVDDDGYIVAANLQEAQETSIVITKTDFSGNILWEETIENASVSSIKSISDGYLIFGDSIEIDPTAASLNDFTKTKAQLLKMNKDHQIVDRVVIKGKPTATEFTDFHGNAVNIDASGTIIAIGSLEPPSQSTLFFVAGINPTTLDTLWTRRKDLIDRNYSNSKSVYFTTTGKIIWASAAVQAQQNTTRAYLTVPVIQPQSDFVNSSYFGENEDNFYSASDIQANAVGFGIVGTYSTPSLDKANMYFVRADQNGTIVPSSALFFDGVRSENNTSLTDKSISDSEDSGNALTATPDGGFLLAGSSLTTTLRGNGGKDLFLIRIDAFGNVLWNKIIGGAGDETVSSVKSTSDGSFIICGSSSINGLSSAFLIKTDRNGNIKN
jgi:hypothetical protein